MVQRYMVNPDPDSADALFEEKDGPWVRYHDYARLQAELEAEVERLREAAIAYLESDSWDVSGHSRKRDALKAALGRKEADGADRR